MTEKKNLPLNMITAEELAEKLEKFSCPLTGKELEKLALDGNLPYWIWAVPVPVAGTDRVSAPLFQFTATKEWLLENGWLSLKEGDPPATPKAGVPLIQRVEELEKTVRALLAEKEGA